jgi:hypothetical protein
VLEEADRLGVPLHRVSQAAASSSTPTTSSTRWRVSRRLPGSRSACSRGRIAEVGVLAVFDAARPSGFLPPDMQAKVSVMLP